MAKPLVFHTFNSRKGAPEGLQDWWCKKCDTIVRYPFKYTKADVNRLVNASSLKCLPPVAGKYAKETETKE